MPAKPSGLGLKLLAALVLLAAAGWGFSHWSRPVARVITVARGNAANVVPGTVIVEAGRVSPIMSEVEGRLIKGELAPGHEFREGEIVAELDTTDVDLEIDRARSELESAKKTIEIARSMRVARGEASQDELAETKLRFDRKEISEADLNRKKREVTIADQQRASDNAEDERRLAALRNNLDTAERKKSKMTIRAPFDGVLTEVFVNKNDLVTSRQPLANIIARSRLVRAKISEENFAAVQVGQKAKVSFLGYPEQTFEASVASKLPSAEPGTQRYSAFLDVRITPEKLLPNLTGDVGIYIDEHKDVVVIPRRALYDAWAYVVENGRVVKRGVRQGYMDLNVVEIVDGLRPGEQIVLEEQDTFREGQRVRVEQVK